MRPSQLITLLVASVLLAACTEPAADRPAVPTPPVTATLSPDPSATPTPAPSMGTATANVYQDPAGSLRFLFEVRNLSRFPVERVRATIRLRDEDDQVIAWQSAYARTDVLSPGEAASVLVVFFLTSPEFDSHEIGVDAHRADYLLELVHPALEIVDLSGRVGQWVPYEVLGRVLNAGEGDAESVRVVASCFDSQGRVAAIISGRPEHRLIPAGESSEFLLSVGSTAGDIVGCKARAQGLLTARQGEPPG